MVACGGSCSHVGYFRFFFFNNPAPTEIYTLSLHDALPIWPSVRRATSSRSGPPRGASSSGGSTARSEEHTSELQSHHDIVCRLLLEKKKPFILRITVKPLFDHPSYLTLHL